MFKELYKACADSPLAVLLRILELVHSGLIDNTIMTKRYLMFGDQIDQKLTGGRDIYYRHPDLFVKQSVVDRYVDDLACTFGISRSQLNVVRRFLLRDSFRT